MPSISDAGYPILRSPIEAYVFVRIAASWTPVARLMVKALTEGLQYYDFAYGKKWLSSPDAFPLDPVNLPLNATIASSPRLFRVLTDAGPDRWGRRLLEEQFLYLQEQAGNAAVNAEKQVAHPGFQGGEI